MIMEDSFCPCCSKEISAVNRLVTESCGHSKCRNCFILEENICAQCPKSYSEVKVIDNVIIPSLKSEPKQIKKTLREHIKNIGNLYKCIICDKEFRSRQQQYYHLHCDEPEESRPFKCIQCSRGFLTENHLKYHVRTHTSEKIYCFICSRKFSNKITLGKHLKRHKQHTKYKCNVCYLEYRDKISFKFHKDSHKELSDSRSITCTVCEKKFSVKSQLKRHLFIHKRDRTKLFQCTICMCKFYRASTLKDHIQKHNNLTKFKCDICYKYFAEQKVLKRHLNLHDASTLYQCAVCDTRLNRKDNLTRHIRNMHPDCKLETYLNRNEKQNSSRTATISKESNEYTGESYNIENIALKVSTNNIGSVGECEENYPIEVSSVHYPESSPIKISEIAQNKFMQCSVIKSIGNAKPLNVILSPINPVKDLRKNSFSLNPINIHALANKKLKKKYDPTEIYRKILFVSNDDDQIPNNSTDVVEEIDENKIKFNINTRSAGTNSNDDTTCSYSNFIEKHWRKNFYS